MRLLGLDLGSQLSGWCCGNGAELPICGAWPMPKARNDDGTYNYGRLLAGLNDYLNVVHRRFGFTAVAYEAPLLITRRQGGDGGYGDNLGKLRLLYPLGAFVEWWCFDREIECFEVTVQAIKAEVTGNHIAPKGDLVAVARNCGLALPEGHGIEDAADAFGAWLLLLRASDQKLAAAWDQHMHLGRGSLL